ncbi:MAG: tetratricopeptide repeat protein, partial [Bacteroidaceae bacterium]|nr:tetratricopeptide repeat protein [Bacteroidaceae bacterium]
MKKSLKTLSFTPSLLKGKCMLLLVMLFTISFAYGQTDEKTQKASALRKEGMTLHDQGKFEEAIKKYDEALKILPYDAILTYEKAYSLTAMGNKNEAKEQLENLFKQGKTDDALSMPYMLYANLLDYDGKAMQALEAFDKALEYVSPSDVAGIQLINYNKALTLYNLKDEDKAKIANRTQQIFNHLYNSIKCNPTHPASFGLYGRIMADEGGYYNAMACFGINALLVGEKVGTLEAA